MIWKRTSETKRFILILSCYALGIVHSFAAYGQTSKQSLQASCTNTPFVSVSVSTLNRNSLPIVELQLTDPDKRQQGFHVKTRLIPSSQYPDVEQVSDAPNNSRVRAVEICGAEQGRYDITIHEQGEAMYRLAVQVGDESLFSKLQGRENGVRRYRFSFHIDPAKDTVNLMWLDRNGKPRPYLVDGP